MLKRLPHSLLLIALAACQDVPTIPSGALRPTSEAAPPVSVALPAVTSPGASVCFTSVSTPGGPHRYRYGRLHPVFPAGAQGGAGTAFVRYRYRMIAPDGTILRVANCVIPATPGVVRVMNRRFAIGDDRATVGGVVRMGDPVLLEPVLVDGTACSDPTWTRDGDGICQPPKTGGDGSGSGDAGGEWEGWDGGGGGGGNDPDPGEPPMPEDPELECPSWFPGCDTANPYEEGPLAWAACVGAGLTFVGGAVLTWVQYHDYYDATTAYLVARLRLEYATPDNRNERFQALADAERQLNLRTTSFAASTGITVGAFLGVVGLCSPSVLFPTP